MSVADEKAGAAASPLASPALEAFRRSGWLIARGFFGAREAAQVERWTEEVLRLPELPGRHMVYHERSLIDPGRRVVQRIENFCPFHPEFDGFVRRGRLASAVAQLLGEPASLFKEKINFKMPGGAGFEPHQDQQAGWSRYAAMFVTALVSVDRATVENGCLEIAEVERLDGLIGPEWQPLGAAELAGLKLVPVPTEPGDVLFFDSYVPHASKPNLTGRCRRMLYLTYNGSSAGDHRARYFAEKRRSFPPDIERAPGVDYKFRV